MAAIPLTKISDAEVSKLLQMQEGHFCELKAVDIRPANLTKSISAFSNAEGGELFIGIDEKAKGGPRAWRGFKNIEDANGHLQAFDQFFPLGADYSYEFLENPGAPGLVLKAQVSKTRDIKCASDGEFYIRRGAQNLPVKTREQIDVLKRDKGLVSFETDPVGCDPQVITNSEHIINFMLQVVPTSEPEPWLKKQQILINDKPTVAGVVLFADEPQAVLPKRCGIKIYRYKTSDNESSRETLDFDPVSIEGCAYDQIRNAVRKTAEIIESVRISTSEGLETVKYPITAVHEIITNAVLHRDYSIADDIHIRIFDNRVEVMSPGTLPGHVTPVNILEERFARNCTIVRLINKFPEPPNKDVGEGLNTAFQAMREMKLKNPVIEQRGGYVTVTLKHETLASPEEMILEYLQSHEEIANKEARDMCHIGSENKMKTVLQRMVRSGLIELVPERTRYTAAYRLPRKGSVKRK
jgi:ATP-dependent DNA helicase RecG